MKKRLLLGLCILVLGGILISAGSALESGPPCCIIEPQSTPWMWGCEIDQFDPNLGILEAVTIDIESCEFLDLVLDSEDTSFLHLTVANSGLTLTTWLDDEEVVLVFDPLQTDCYLTPDDPQEVTLDNPLGLPDFVGDDSCEIDFDECKDDSRTYLEPSDLANYMGSGQVIFETSATSEWDIIGDGDYFVDDDSQIGHGICITYEYQPFDCIEDNAPPVISVSVTPNILWPPNHKYWDVATLVSVSDDCDPSPSVQLLSITSNEPDNALGDGNTYNDIVIVDDYQFRLRAERGMGDTGRTYTITYQATDTSGNSATSSATVFVPLNWL